MTDSNEHNLGDLVAYHPPIIGANVPFFGIVADKQYDKRWKVWYYVVVWNDFLEKSTLFKYRDEDIAEFKYNLIFWIKKK